MITDERLKQLMANVGMPNSISLMQALRQCDMEARLSEREECAKIVDVPDGVEAWKIRGGEEGIELLRDMAAAIRAR